MTAISTLGLAVATILLMGATFVIALGVRAEMGKYREDSRFHNYTQIDNIYYSIQREIILHPHLSEPIGKRNEGERCQYDAFAFMTWNFIEAIYDQCEGDKNLHETWDVIVQYEAHRHKIWFLEDRNQKKFKRSFRKIVREEIFHIPTDPSLDEGQSLDLTNGGGPNGFGRA